MSYLIRYGDTVTFATYNGPLYVDKSDGMIKCDGRTSASKLVLRHPTKKDSKDVILGGASVQLLFNGQLCKIRDDGFIVCGKDVLGGENIKILDKHGQDKIQLENGHYIKFRQPNNGVDCSVVPGRQALNCKIKQSWQYYGFIMRKV